MSKKEYTPELKQRLMTELASGTISVAAMARREGIKSAVLYTWTRKDRMKDTEVKTEAKQLQKKLEKSAGRPINVKVSDDLKKELESFDQRRELERCYQLIGKLTLQLEHKGYREGSWKI